MSSSIMTCTRIKEKIPSIIYNIVPDITRRRDYAEMYVPKLDKPLYFLIKSWV